METLLHAAVCNAVALMNCAPIRVKELHEAHNILRQALIDYANAALIAPPPNTAEPIEMLIDSAAMQPTGLTKADIGDDGLPVLIMKGVISFGSFSFECGQLSNGQRIFFGSEYQRFMDVVKDIIKTHN